MTARSDFTDEEWELVRDASALAGLIVITAGKGGAFRETFAMAKAYAEARKQHGESELLDELVAERPKTGRRYHSDEELREDGLRRLGEAAELLERKATPEEVEQYRAFVVNLAERVAEAHKEEGERISTPEQAAISEISASVGATTPPATA
jgi:hypothetical protein